MYHISPFFVGNISIPNNLKNLDLSYKTDLDFRIVLEREKTNLTTEFRKTDVDM